MGYIYVIENTQNHKRYIGQTTKTIQQRWKTHIKCSQYRKQPLYIAMRKYGIDSFQIRQLEEVEPPKSLDEREQYYIKKYNTIIPNGYNATTGGSKFKDDNPMFHPEIAHKVSQYFIGDKNPAKRKEVREKIRKSATGKKASVETRKKMSINNGRFWKGKHLSQETRNKISLNHGMRGKFDELNPVSVKVAQLDKETGEIIQIHNSLNGAIRFLITNGEIQKGNASHISGVCAGREKTAYGYKWKKID